MGGLLGGRCSRYPQDLTTGGAKVCVIGADRVGEMGLKKEIEEVLSAQGRK